MKIISWSEASKLGLDKYYTGKPCINGHIEVRDVKFRSCKKCAAIRQSKYSKKHPDRVKDSFKKYRIKNKDKVKVWDKNYYLKNLDKFIYKRKEYYLKNKDKWKYCPEKVTPEMKLKSKIWRYKNKDKTNASRKKWEENNKEYCRINSANGAARRRNALGKFTKKDIQNLYIHQNGICNGCLRDMNGVYHIDHIMPVSRGGTNNPENLQLLCPPCNFFKTDKHPDEWKKELTEWRKIICQNM